MVGQGEIYYANVTYDAAPFRLLAKARSHLPFQGRYIV